MENKNNNYYIFLLFLLPSHVAAQSSPPGNHFTDNSVNDFTPSTIIIIIIGVIFIFTGVLAVFLRQFSQSCFGLNVVPAAGTTVARGIDAEAIKSLPTYFYSDVKQHRMGKVELECAVCLCEFQDPEALRLLPGCSHVFHPRCIDPWLASHVTCPICRHCLEPGTNYHEPYDIINIPLNQVELDGPDQDRQTDDDHQSGDNHDDDGTEMKRIVFVGKFPRSHSTGHSLADSQRFKLRLPEEVQYSSVNRSSNNGVNRCSWFSMTPPIMNPRSGLVRSPIQPGLIISSSKNLPPTQPAVKTSLWPI